MFVFTESITEMSVPDTNSYDFGEQRPATYLPVFETDKIYNGSPLDNHKLEVERLQSQISKYEEEISQLKEMLRRKAEETVESTGELSSPQNSKRSLSPSPKGKNQGDDDKQEPKQQFSQPELRKITSKLKEYKKKVQRLESMNTKLTSDSKALGSKIQRQYQDLYQQDIINLKYQIMTEKQINQTERWSFQGKIKDLEEMIRKLYKQKRKWQVNRASNTETQEREIKDKTKEIDSLKERIEDLTKKNKTMERMNASDEIEKKQLRNQLDGKQSQLRRVREEYESYQLQSKREKEDLQNRLKSLQLESSRKIREIEQKYRSSLLKLETCEKTLALNQKHLQSSQQEFLQLKRAKQKAELQFKDAIQAKEEQNMKLTLEKNKLIRSRDDLITDKQMLQNEKKRLEESNLALKNLKEKQQAENKLLETTRKQLQSQKEALLSTTKQQTKEIENLNKEKENHLDEVDRLITELDSYKEDNFTLNNFRNLARKYMAEIQAELGMLVPKNFEIDPRLLDEIQLNLMRYKYFYDSVILSNMPIHKTAFLVNELRHFLHSQFKAELIYRFDPLNSTNFHKYFDKKDKVLAIIKLTNGTVVGGFTAHAFEEEKIAKPGEGFIFSLTDEKIYRRRSDPRLPVNSYDIYYFILGNAEIRLKSQEKRMFSNFGIANSTFETSGDLRTGFLKVSEMCNNDLQVETYEFYQLRLRQ